MNKVFISCKESIIENNRSFYGSFSIGPFTETQSLTIANALRRTLLSECSGLAIISVLIENVTHEYSTLPGVRDSVLDILLNLKEIVLKKATNPWLFYKQKSVGSLYESVGSSFFKPMVGYLKVKGPGIVRAKDLRLPPFIQIVDPDQYIATLSENGVLNMKVVIMEGQNYIIQKNNEFIDYSFIKKRRTLFKNLKELLNKSQMVNKKESGGSHQNDSLNFNIFKKSAPLNIDAVFNPIKKVNYIIEVNDNKLVDQSNEKYSLIDDISSFMESGELYKSNFPFFHETYSSLQNGTHKDKTSLNRKGEAVMNDLINYVEDYSTEELWSYSRSLHPLRKEGLLHTVMLEIWTNGSIHPREALSFAFSKLTNLFLNFEKTKIYSPMYKDISSYKKCLNTLSLASQTPSVLVAPSSEFNIFSENNKTNNLKNESLMNLESLDISVLNLNLRAYTTLKRENVNTIKDLLAFIPSMSKETLLQNYNLDGITIETIFKLTK